MNNYRFLKKSELFKIVKIIIHFGLWPIFFVLKHLIPKDRIVILHTYDRDVYRENTKFLCEYLATNTNLKIYWFTCNDQIKSYLRKKKIRYISLTNPLHLIVVLLRAKIVIDSGDGFINYFGICKNKNTKTITTLHGCGPKVSFSRSDDMKTQLSQIIRASKFDYVNFPSKYSVDWVGKRIYLLPNKKLISFGYPRCDIFFNSKLVKNRFLDKPIAKFFVPELKNSSKIIFYTPTWRPYKYEFPLRQLTSNHIDLLSKWLENNDIYLFYTIHSVGTPSSNLDVTDRIIYIDTKKNIFFDTNEFMLETDLLLNDYSTTSTDFALLNRPQVFYMPDYEFYASEKGFVEDYRLLLVGEEIFSLSDFQRTIFMALSDPDKYVVRFQEKRKELLRKYYDIDSGIASKNFGDFITNLVDHS